MREIPLTRGQVALVDDEDYDWLNQWKWYAKYNKRHNNYYAVRGVFNGKNMSHVWMHRLILNIIDPKLFADHINHNPLDNRRSNLRSCTYYENSLNRRSRKNSSSIYLGVSKGIYKWQTKNGNIVIGKEYWTAVIHVDKKSKRLGVYPFTLCGEIKAAKAYDTAASKYHGEFANLNFK